VLALFALAVGIGQGYNEELGCYTPEEAQAQADANVAAISACRAPEYEICTQTYQQAEDLNKECWAACYNDNDNGPAIAKCREGCDAILQAALAAYNTCIAKAEKKCADTNPYTPLEPICDVRN
jgi:hypothetical protein